MLGGTLLDTSGAVIDAGGSDRDDRRHAGLPATDLPGVPALATARVSAECVGVTRAVAEALCESSTRYPNPDVLLGEILAGLGEGKEAATLLRAGSSATGRHGRTGGRNASIPRHCSWS